MFCLAVPAIADNKDIVTLKLQDVPAKTAIETLFKGTNKSYILDAKINTDKLITVSLVDCQWEKALGAILGALKLILKTDQSLYIIEPRPEPINIVSIDPVKLTNTPPEKSISFEKIQLQHMNGSELLEVLGYKDSQNTKQNNYLRNYYPSR